jgi:hypothetical protein
VNLARLFRLVLNLTQQSQTGGVVSEISQKPGENPGGLRPIGYALQPLGGHAKGK